jgi:hypothetical protein
MATSKKKAAPKKTAAAKKAAPKKAAAKKAAPKKAAPKKTAAAKKTSAAKPSKTLTAILGRALTDKDFRDLLFKDRSKALEGYRLSEADLEALGRLDEKDLASQADKVGARAGIKIAIKITKKF